ncbi:hypothetical protein FE257_007856 [Aspergillus nanangensis]|uniref:Zn(2)-C6 fungal-type domain-containing protein n=1 Tax=Aspergillus nanangensis TaxID=2582783 RepID=A0AAD4CXM9_ASPNN|nr:hypothetical protein FE257_007856 [Aspergillus nanangensis]
MASSPKGEQGKRTARACEFCRARKIRCDNRQPACGSCSAQGQACVYKISPPKQRPTTAALNALRAERQQLFGIIQALKAANQTHTIESLLESITIGPGGKVHQTQIESPPPPPPPPLVMVPVDPELPDVQTPPENLGQETDHDNNSVDTPSDEEPDVATFYSVDEEGDLSTFGPSSSLQAPVHRKECVTPYSGEHLWNALVAKAALSRQNEYAIYASPDIAGVPVSLAMHLLDLHWNRQHHTLLLTYRPVIMRDILQNGPYASPKFSQRAEVRDDPSNHSTAGGRFFRRCDELLMRESLLTKPTIPTIVGPLLLGSTLNAKGETSKGWLYTGYALRMVYDVGFHNIQKVTPENAEEMELRRRVFWGAFVWDKFQSLYLGRPMGIQSRDAHLSYQFMDTIEEGELFVPYHDPALPSSMQQPPATPPTPIHSVSCFQQLCRLSKLMASIINEIYFIGATASSVAASLPPLDDSLTRWAAQLPRSLQFNPRTWTPGQPCPAPNVLNLHTTYHSLLILLHRPLVAGGHLQSSSAEGSSSSVSSSWKKCASAARTITNLVFVHHAVYTLRGAPYLISYALYVACTIHVRNVAAMEQTSPGENSQLLALSLQQLEDLSVPNAGVSRPLHIIRKLMAAKGVKVAPYMKEQPQPPPVMDLVDDHHHSAEEEGLEELGDADLDDVLRLFSGKGGPVVCSSYGEDGGLDMLASGGNVGEAFPDDLLYGFMEEQSGMDLDFHCN